MQRTNSAGPLRPGARARGLVGAAMLAFLGCRAEEAPPAPAEALPDTQLPRVFTLAYPTEWLSRRIAGDDLQVIDGRPDHDDPEAWRPAPELVFTMKEEASVILVGGDFEPWFQEANVSPFALHRLVDALGPAALERTEGGVLPFPWLEPESMEVVARGLADHFARIHPSREAGFRARRAELSKVLAELDREAREVSVGRLFGARPAYAYLARAVGSPFEHLAVDLGRPPSGDETRMWRARKAAFQASLILCSRTPAPEVDRALRANGLVPVVFDLMTHRSAEDRRAGREYPEIFRRNLAALRRAAE